MQRGQSKQECKKPKKKAKVKFWHWTLTILLLLHLLLLGLAGILASLHSFWRAIKMLPRVLGFSCITYFPPKLIPISQITPSGPTLRKSIYLRSSCFMGIKINVKVDVIIIKKIFQVIISWTWKEENHEYTTVTMRRIYLQLHWQQQEGWGEGGVVSPSSPCSQTINDICNYLYCPKFYHNSPISGISFKSQWNKLIGHLVVQNFL